ncbi:MAG: 4,5-DOPA dioxygenase extradiol [Flammeovirgaceae bacterium]|nr:MAG: 4,5-DOPA dioxygenase extradiol [Flammeovirgaceae bacterium]
MATLNDLKKYTDKLYKENTTMPLLFIGHGSPMNGIEDNEFSRGWAAIGKEIPAPQAVLCISAHWYTKGTWVTAMEKPKTIHDFYGFPKALFDVQYPAPGSPELARHTANRVTKTTVGLDHEWGLDHGTWSVVRQMYPEATIPVFQLSIDSSKPPEYHYELAREISELRKKGVLIIGSGNMVHNLRIMNWNLPDAGFDWAIEANEKFKDFIQRNSHQPLLRYESLGKAAQLAIPTPDHYLPMIYILGLKDETDSISFFNDKTVMGSVSMTSFKVG